MYIDFTKHQLPIKELIFNSDDVEDDFYRGIIFILTNDTKINFIAVGDCCSSSIIEKYENYDFQSLIGKIITSVKEIDLPDDYEYKEETSYGDCISLHLYEIRFKDNEEIFKFLLVNYSNGYYDGWLETEII